MPKRAIFPLNIETGFIANAPFKSNNAALSIYSLWPKYNMLFEVEKMVTLLRLLFTQFYGAKFKHHKYSVNH